MERVYRDPAARRMSDVDIVVSPASRERAHRSLTAAGFVRVGLRPNRPHTDRTHIAHKYVLEHGTSAVHLDVHFRLAPSGWLRVFNDELLDAGRPGNLSQIPCWHLTDPDNTCIVLYHLGHHGFTITREALGDLPALRRAGLLNDVPGLLMQCRKWGCLTIAWQALALMNATFPEVAVPLPQGSAPPRLSRLYLSRVLRPGTFPPYAASRNALWDRVVHRWFLLDSTTQRLQALADPAWRLARDFLAAPFG